MVVSFHDCSRKMAMIIVQIWTSKMRSRSKLSEMRAVVMDAALVSDDVSMVRGVFNGGDVSIRDVSGDNDWLFNKIKKN